MTATPGVGQVHATQDQLNHMARRCTETGESIDAGMRQLLGNIQALSGTGMQGAGNTALQSVSVQLNDGLARILSALDELGGKMTNASTQFGSSDDESAQEIRAAAASADTGSVVNILRG